MMEKKLTKAATAVLLILFCAFSLSAQEPISNPDKIQKGLQKHDAVKSYKIDDLRKTPAVIHLSDETRATKAISSAPELIEEILQLRETIDQLELKKAAQYKDNVNIDRYQQFYDGVKVEHGQVVALGVNQKLHSFVNEFYILNQLNTTPTLSEEEALDAALGFVNASEYAWEAIENMNCNFVFKREVKEALDEYYQNYLPKGELVIVDNFYTEEMDMSLAYKFNIYASIPLSRAYVYINAHTGEVMLNNPIIKHASGDTRYSGNRTFGSEIGTSGSFELLNTSKGGGMETRNLEGVGGLPISVGAVYELSEAFEDDNGTWTAAEHTETIFTNEVNNDDIALDAHWGSEIVYDYWDIKHGRKSYDDNDAKIFSFVHYGVNYDNAFWNGSYMTYGDGSYQQGTNPTGDFGPLTSMDVCAHEIGHAICTHTSDLVYARESGAMNEGFSDIWAAAVENYVLTDVDGSLPYDPWGIGEQVDERDGGTGPGTAMSQALRWMDDPQAAGDPDCYGGTNWEEPECGEPTLANDQCGVHTNSGVLNKWFYLLVNGSGQAFSPGLNKAASEDGVTDQGNSYSFSGLGFEAAEQIAFLTETFLTPNSKFLDARYASQLAAGILYGPCSVEQDITLQAWNAVNVLGDGPNCDARVEFFDAASVESEESGQDGCAAVRTVSIGIFAIGTTETVTISAIGTGANPATDAKDFNLLTTTVDFSSQSIQTVEVEIFDDAIVEPDEEITLSISGHSSTHIITVSDNDIVPEIGSATVDLLAEEQFNGTDHPTDWSTLTINGEGGNDWKFDGTGSASGRAYVSYDIVTTPVYNQTADAHVILRTPLLDARAKTNLNVSFNWEAGGEADAVDGTLFDYGSFGYSYNGTDFTYIEDFVGDVGGTVPTSGTFNMSLPTELSNKQFYLGWRWYNDALVGTGFSFAIDNAHVTGDAVPIATTATSSDAAQVDNNNEAYFYNSNGEIIAKVKSLGGDFGCVDVSIQEAGTGQQTFEFGDRAEKVFQVTSTNNTDSYEVTFYFTAAELASFGPDAQALNMIKVGGTDIDAADETNSVIIENMDLTTMSVNGDGDISYTATFTGFSVFGVYLPTVILPVELLDFSAKVDKAQVYLNWYTASEKNNEGFEVMRRAADEDRFYSIGWVDGHGTTNTMIQYDYIDEEVRAGVTYYYQLNQIDFDRTSQLSNIVAVTLDQIKGYVNVFPNPSSGIVHVNAIDNNFKSNRSIEVYSIDRHLVRTINNPDTANQASVNLTNLPSGVYFIKIHLEGEVVTKRVFIERE